MHTDFFTIYLPVYTDTDTGVIDMVPGNAEPYTPNYLPIYLRIYTDTNTGYIPIYLLIYLPMYTDTDTGVHRRSAR